MPVTPTAAARKKKTLSAGAAAVATAATAAKKKKASAAAVLKTKACVSVVQKCAVVAKALRSTTVKRSCAAIKTACAPVHRKKNAKKRVMHGGGDDCGGPPKFDLVTGADFSPGANGTNYAHSVSPHTEVQMAPLALLSERLDYNVFPGNNPLASTVNSDGGTFNLPIPMGGGSVRRGCRRI